MVSNVVFTPILMYLFYEKQILLEQYMDMKPGRTIQRNIPYSVRYYP